MKNYIPIILLLFFTFNTFCQNTELIQNPDFYKKDPVEWFSVKNFDKNGAPVFGDDRRPVFYQKSWCRSCPYKEGDNSDFLLIVFANQVDTAYSQNISTKLNSKLIPSINYEIKLNYTNSLRYRNSKDSKILIGLGNCYTEFIQILLTVQKPTLESGIWKYDEGKILTIPISTYKFDWFTDSIAFVADKAYNYLTIGNFGANYIKRWESDSGADGYKTGIQPHASYLIEYINLNEVPCKKGKIEFDAHRKPIYINCRDIKIEDSITVSKKDIKIQVFDDSQPDGDIISMYHNDILKLSSEELKSIPIDINFNVQNNVDYLIFDVDKLGKVGDVNVKVNFNNEKIFKFTIKSDLSKAIKINYLQQDKESSKDFSSFNNIYFENRSSQLTENSKVILQDLVKSINSKIKNSCEIIVFYNENCFPENDCIELAEKRADAIRDYCYGQNTSIKNEITVLCKAVEKEIDQIVIVKSTD